MYGRWTTQGKKPFKALEVFYRCLLTFLHTVIAWMQLRLVSLAVASMVIHLAHSHHGIPKLGKIGSRLPFQVS